MNYSTYTAVIFTFHHRSALFALVLALIFSSLMYWLFIKKRSHRRFAIIFCFLISLVVGANLADEVFEQQPFRFELVQAGF